TQVDPRLTAAYNQFGFDLLRRLPPRQKSGNVLISPLSIAVALAMTQNGATGDTQRAIAAALRLESLTLPQSNQANDGLRKSLGVLDANVSLSMANSLWTRRGVEFKAEFLDANRRFFDARVASLDFASPAAHDTINAWVSQA